MAVTDKLQEPKRRLPVTLLSGFLGAGKTTLLENILTDPNHGFRVGVIVNDVGSLNIDATLLSNHDVTRKEEQVIAMQNGCICCTLRGDLLEEVARLAKENAVDYLVIESSGVSEPMQVAETFSEEFAEANIMDGYYLAGDKTNEMEEGWRMRLAEILKAGGLSKIARLDTCVTVVDAVNFMLDFATADMLKDRRNDVPEEDDRNITDLQCDQVEFADVIVINKCDLVAKQEIDRIKGVVQNLNPRAKIFTAIRSDFGLGNILDTKMFSYEEATLNAGWLRSLREKVNPETEEYGIGTFVYRARRPFHPDRLWQTIREVFVVVQMEYDNENEDGQEEDEAEGNNEESEGDEEEEDDEDEEDSEDDSEEGSDDESNSELPDDEDTQPQLDTKARIASKLANKTFGPLLRSKGFFWLATRPLMFGEWSQAGVMLSISGGDIWRCETPECEWPEGQNAREVILRDMEGKWGDRRQEIVFIGQQMRDGGEKRLREAFDSCLLTDQEFMRWERAMESRNPQAKLDRLFDDGFEEWML